MESYFRINSLNIQTVINMINSILEPTAPQIRRSNLLLHQGGSAVTRSELAQTPTPKPTKSWHPIPHLQLLQVVERALLSRGFVIVEQAHGLTHEGARYFGLLQVQNNHPGHETCKVIGLRNSNDRSISAGLVAGNQVVVCSNLCFSGEIQIARKHTPKIMQDLPQMAYDAVVGLNKFWDQQQRRIEVYRRTKISDQVAHDLVIRSVDMGIIATRMVPKVLTEYRVPRHAEFKPRNLYSYYNSYTELWKGRLDLLPNRSRKLHDLLDGFVGLN